MERVRGLDVLMGASSPLSDLSGMTNLTGMTTSEANTAANMPAFAGKSPMGKSPMPKSPLGRRASAGNMPLADKENVGAFGTPASVRNAYTTIVFVVLRPLKAPSETTANTLHALTSGGQQASRLGKFVITEVSNEALCLPKHSQEGKKVNGSPCKLRKQPCRCASIQQRRRLQESQKG